MNVSDLGLALSKKITDANRKWEASALIDDNADAASAEDQLVRAVPKGTYKAYALTLTDNVLRLELA